MDKKNRNITRKRKYFKQFQKDHPEYFENGSYSDDAVFMAFEKYIQDRLKELHDQHSKFIKKHPKASNAQWHVYHKLTKQRQNAMKKTRANERAKQLRKQEYYKKQKLYERKAEQKNKIREQRKKQNQDKYKKQKEEQDNKERQQDKKQRNEKQLHNKLQHKKAYLKHQKEKRRVRLQGWKETLRNPDVAPNLTKGQNKLDNYKEPYTFNKYKNQDRLSEQAIHSYMKDNSRRRNQYAAVDIGPVGHIKDPHGRLHSYMGAEGIALHSAKFWGRVRSRMASNSDSNKRNTIMLGVLQMLADVNQKVANDHLFQALSPRGIASHAMHFGKRLQVMKLEHNVHEHHAEIRKIAKKMIDQYKNGGKDTNKQKNHKDRGKIKPGSPSAVHTAANRLIYRMLNKLHSGYGKNNKTAGMPHTGLNGPHNGSSADPDDPEIDGPDL